MSDSHDIFSDEHRCSFMRSFVLPAELPVYQPEMVLTGSIIGEKVLYIRAVSMGSVTESIARYEKAAAVLLFGNPIGMSCSCSAREGGKSPGTDVCCDTPGPTARGISVVAYGCYFGVDLMQHRLISLHRLQFFFCQVTFRNTLKSFLLKLYAAHHGKAAIHLD